GLAQPPERPLPHHGHGHQRANQDGIHHWSSFEDEFNYNICHHNELNGAAGAGLRPATLPICEHKQFLLTLKHLFACSFAPRSHHRSRDLMVTRKTCPPLAGGTIQRRLIKSSVCWSRTAEPEPALTSADTTLPSSFTVNNTPTVPCSCIS